MDGQKKTRQLSKEELADYGSKIQNYKEMDPKQTASILDILLRADITLSLLKESKLHKTVGTLKAIFTEPKDDEGIVSKSRELYNKMKTIYEGESKGGKDDKSQQSDDKKDGGNKSREETKESKNSGKNSVTKPVKQPQEPVSLPKLDPEIRNKFFGLIFKYLSEENDKDPIIEKKQDIVPIAGELEAQIYYAANNDSQKYKTICMRKMELLGHKTNDELRKKLLRKEIHGEDFAKKEMKELMSAKLLENIKTMQDEAIDARISNWRAITANITSMTQCRKCKSQRVQMYQQQTRSADEPMTSFYTCLDCGKQWKEN